jgi:hypothetical protein
VLGEGIFTQAERWEELRKNVLEAVQLHFDECESVGWVRLISDGGQLESLL